MIDENLLRYIPKKKQACISELFRDSDGIWGALKDGYIDTIMCCPIIHVETIKELKENFKYVEKENDNDKG